MYLDKALFNHLRKSHTLLQINKIECIVSSLNNILNVEDHWNLLVLVFPGTKPQTIPPSQLSEHAPKLRPLGVYCYYCASPGNSATIMSQVKLSTFISWLFRFDLAFKLDPFRTQIRIIEDTRALFEKRWNKIALVVFIFIVSYKTSGLYYLDEFLLSPSQSIWVFFLYTTSARNYLPR